MSPALKRMIAALAICLFVLAWIVLAISISGFIPRNVIAETVFYIVMGLGWAFPLMPLLKWMEKK